MNSVLLYTYTTSPLSMSTDMSFGGFCILAIVNNAAVTVEVHISFLISLFSSDKYPGVEMLDHMVILFLIF